MRCVATHACEHATTGDRPLKAFLAARIIACDACLPRYSGPLAAANRDAAAATLCDYCLTKSEDRWFRPVASPAGPCLVMGDMCHTCSDDFLTD